MAQVHARFAERVQRYLQAVPVHRRLEILVAAAGPLKQRVIGVEGTGKDGLPHQFQKMSLPVLQVRPYQSRRQV